MDAGPLLREAPADDLRRACLRDLPPRPAPGTAEPVAQVTGDEVLRWSPQQCRAEIDRLKRAELDWDNTTGSARKWWEAFEVENKERLPLVLRLCLELVQRKATITMFFLAYVYSGTDNIQANLYYLDYMRLKKQEEEKKRKDDGEPH